MLFLFTELSHKREGGTERGREGGSERYREREAEIERDRDRETERPGDTDRQTSRVGETQLYARYFTYKTPLTNTSLRILLPISEWATREGGRTSTSPWLPQGIWITHTKPAPDAGQDLG